MKLKTIVAIVAAVLGLGASAQAYRMASAPAGPDTKPVAAHSSTQDKAAAKPQVKVPKIIPATRFEWAPCKPPAVQKGDDCVTEVVQTIVIPSTPAPAQSGGSSSGGGEHSTGGHSGGGGDDSAGDDDSTGGDDDSEDDDEPEDDGNDNGGEEDD